MNKEKDSIRNTYVIIFGITLIVVLGVAGLTPVLPLIKETFDVTEQQIGLFIAFFNIPAIFLTPIFGILADRYGRKKFLVPLLFLCAISGVLSGFTNDFNVLLFLRLLNGVGAAALGALNITLIGDLFNGEERLKVISYNEIAANLGFALFPVFVGLLALLSWRFPFFLFILAVPIAIFTLIYLEDSKHEKTESFKGYFSELFRTLKDFKILLIYLAGFSTFFFFSGAYSTYFPFLLENNFGFTPLITGFLMMIVSFSAAVTSSQIVKLNKRFTGKWLLTLSYLFFGFALLSMMLSKNVIGLIISLILYGIGHGINLPSLHLLTIDLTNQKSRGAAISFREVCFKISGSISPIMMGWLYSVSGLNLIYLFSGFYSLMFFGFLFFTFKKI